MPPPAKVLRKETARDSQGGRGMTLDPRTDGTTGLPTDLAVDQTTRLQVFYGVGVALWAINLLMDVWLAPNGDRGPYRLAIEASAGLLAGATALFMKRSRATARTKVALGAALIVPHALALALLNSWTAQPTTMRPLSGITVLILFFAMLAPARPARIFVAAVVAASMDPVGVWVAHLRGLAVPSPLATLAMFYPNYACAVLAITPAHLLYGLGRRLQEARALGSYQLVERLGEGGMGEVWVARHRLLARSAAIKLVRPDRLAGADSPDATRTLERFEREAQATAALTSPHTIRLFDFGLSREGAFYYVMELLDGCDLESLIRQHGPLPAGRALYLLQQICRSLAEAHAKGFVHRDIKPANVYVCRMGLEFDFVKVLDFGLVKYESRAPASATLTGQVMAMGTPAYMAPEVILGGGDVDRRVDVYAVGCVAYYLLTGERVFDAITDMRLMVKHLHEEPVPPSQRCAHAVPPGLDALVLDCLRKNPDERPADAGEVLRRLSRCDTGTWDQGTAQSWWERHMPAANADLRAVPGFAA